MSHERLKHIKQNLLASIEGQVCNLHEADCEELGEAIDMLKDLEEALYYCTITEAMEGKGRQEEKSNHGAGNMMYYTEYEPMYYSTTPGVSSSNGGRMYNQGNNSRMYNDPGSSNGWEGRSPQSRRMYMEAKEYKHDKTAQLRELEKYMQELSTDVVEMIQDASPEEKQYLEKKISALASKIGQMK